MEGAGHGESAPEKAQRRPRLATLDQGSMNEAGNERQSRRRLTELPVKRKTSSDVPAEQGSTPAEEVGRWRERERERAFPSSRGELFLVRRRDSAASSTGGRRLGRGWTL